MIELISDIELNDFITYVDKERFNLCYLMAQELKARRSKDKICCDSIKKDENSKCEGYQKSDIDDEPIERCKECPKNVFYEDDKSWQELAEKQDEKECDMMVETIKNSTLNKDKYKQLDKDLTSYRDYVNDICGVCFNYNNGYCAFRNLYRAYDDKKCESYI